ncbi:MAG: peptidylprolyl isomerase [Phycisphaerae bacterium]|nr:peptidylprolyl isomerase [Phycisphaerae bacterium]
MKRFHWLFLLTCATGSLGMTGGTCDSSANLRLIDALRGPPAIIASSPREDAAERTFEVDLRSYPDAFEISWEFGDGSAKRGLDRERGKRISHVYSASGTFTVTVRLYSLADVIGQRPAELIATGALPVTVLSPNQLPVPTFSVQEVTPAEPALGITRRFDASRSRDPDGSIVEYRWDFGDGGQAIGSDVEYAFERAGLYTVRLTVKDDRGGRAFTERTLFLNGVPEARFRFEIDDVNPLLVRFNASRSTDPDGEIVRYDWDFGDGVKSPDGGLQVSHTFAAPGEYFVRLDVFDDQGQSDFVFVQVVVTSDEIALTSISERYGEVGTNLNGLRLMGANFAEGATARLQRGATRIDATNVTRDSSQQLTVDFDLSRATLGDYDVIVENPDTGTASLSGEFRVVTANLVRLTTSLGDIVFELVDDAPVTTSNFLQYVTDGFYDGTIFHRVVPDFVVQGGGFLPGLVRPEGRRPPIVNEFSPTRSNLRATVAMAKVGGDPNSATSEFFVNLKDNSQNLDNQNGGFTVFARVIEGMDVVDDIAAVPLNGEQPVQDVLLIRAERE